jgi:hypothetical protein
MQNQSSKNNEDHWRRVLFRSQVELVRSSIEAGSVSGLSCDVSSWDLTMCCLEIWLRNTSMTCRTMWGCAIWHLWVQQRSHKLLLADVKRLCPDDSYLCYCCKKRRFTSARSNLCDLCWTHKCQMAQPHIVRHVIDVLRSQISRQHITSLCHNVTWCDNLLSDASIEEQTNSACDWNKTRRQWSSLFLLLWFCITLHFGTLPQNASVFQNLARQCYTMRHQQSHICQILVKPLCSRSINIYFTSSQKWLLATELTGFHERICLLICI